jgi:hypothetical protein
MQSVINKFLYRYIRLSILSISFKSFSSAETLKKGCHEEVQSL